ncbi:hypothetical protein Q7P37_007067 [Cladosporium fusiforme]
MQPTTLLRRALALNLQLHASRSFATMSTPSPPQHFTLDRSIFNSSLYNHIRDFWFADLPPNFTGVPNFSVLQRWWAIKVSPAQKAAFDNSCASNFLPAIKSLGPENLSLPPFTSHADETASSDTLAAPLIKEVQTANFHSAQQGAETLLSLILLLDQIPRNIYRDPATLPLAYTHYDRLAFALLRSSMRMSPNPAALPAFQARPAVQSWILMPLMHSEDLQAHMLWDELATVHERTVEANGDEEGMKYAESGRQAWEGHVEAIRAFGRYPHRNECLGRVSTAEEKEWLAKGQTWGVEQKGSEKDEL